MKNNIENIIIRVLSREASSEEINKLNDWLQADKQNRTQFDLIKSYWNAQVTSTLQGNAEKSWIKFYNKINSSQPSQKQIKRSISTRMWFKIASLAAVSILFILCITTYFPKKNTIRYYTCDIKNSQPEHILSDGTKISLSKNSYFIYSSEYGKKKREIELTGEAFFEVAKDSQKPFIVHTGKVSVRVLGTVFNVKTDERTHSVITTLLSGSVRFDTPHQQLTLQPDQQLIYNNDKDSILVKKVDAEIYAIWKENLYRYKSKAFGKLIKEIETIYNTPITIRNPALTEIKISGSLKKDLSLDQIFTLLSQSLPFSWKWEGEGIFIE
ncbi:FecR family protein [Parabacteroides pacaensis]|uniref:FecR family protein n=1 Tax=Parabacteroides pacaensis TaxID=2086575 RepID=UPI000D101717|nr:FecR domain-containing protein [Parabacteroides pacaensis]